MNATGLIRAFHGARLDGPFVDASHPDYGKLRKVYNGMIDRHPAAIVRARSVADVQAVVRIAAENEALLAVRCGGHSFPGLSTCDDGIVLDLSLMNGIAVDAVGRTAEVAGGALLRDLDLAGSRFGLVTPAGVVSHTGVAGLTLGGGMGWLSRRFGLTVDNLIGAEVVTADGRLIRTSSDVEPDLFWAIRGGGGNFGVVTKFLFNMHPIGGTVTGRWIYPPNDFAGVLSRYREYLVSAPRELTTAFFLSTTELAIVAFWSGRIERAEAILAPFGALGRPSSAAIEPIAFVDHQKRFDEHSVWGRRCYAKGGYLREIDELTIRTMIDCVASATAPEGEIYVLQLGGAVCDTAEDATPYTGREAGHYWIAQPVWDDGADDERCIAWGRKTAARLVEHSLRGNYVNEQSDFGKDVAVSAYGAEKYARLGAIKARYDPSNLFQLNQNIEPKHQRV